MSRVVFDGEVQENAKELLEEVREQVSVTKGVDYEEVLRLCTYLDAALEYITELSETIYRYESGEEDAMLDWNP